MYFKRLEMQGFKSFADPVVIDFHEGITCVVGPNGSGKSNISDAIRWVLGEQSPKALRGGKMEEVIFAGTASRKSRGMAEVTLVIDNSEHFLDIDYNEVAITRRMYRSGESEYLINNNSCRLRDIRALIMDTGIGVDGYSIIGQGKIADIVSTKPESRREIFEEAAGIVAYKTKRGEAERKLESTSANLERVRDIIEELESRIGTLKEDSIKAKEYLELKERYRGLEINIILRNIETIQQNSKVYADDLERLSNSIVEATKDQEFAYGRGGELNEKRTIMDSLAEETRDNILKLVQEINEITNASQLSAERLSGIEKETDIIHTDLVMIKERLDVEQSNLDRLKKEEDALDGEIAKAKENLEKEILEFNDASEAQAKTLAIADEGKNQLFELSSEKTACESEIKGIDNISENLRNRKEEINQLYSETGKVSDNLSLTVSERKRDQETKESEVRALTEKLNGLISERGELTESVRRLNETIERNRLEISQLSSRRRTMEEMESNYEGYFAGVRSVMRAGISGLRGVVAELMDVPKEYTLAVETALGANLQNIICNTDDDAKRGVNYLKENKGGRATFLPIATMKGVKPADTSLVSGDSGFVDLAQNIVKYDDEFAAIYSYLFRKIAVAKDMDAAIRLSKKGSGLIFVTPEGEIVTPQGGITGGTFKNKTANILDRKAEINELGEKISGLEGKVSEDSVNLESMRARLSSIQDEEQKLNGDKHRLDVEITALISDIKAISENLDKEKLNIDRYEEEISRIDRQLSEAAEMKTRQEKRITEIVAEVETVNKEIEEALNLIESQRIKTEACSESVTAARIALNEIETRGEAQKRLSERVEEQVDSYNSQIKEKEAALANLAEERAALIKASEEQVDVGDKLTEKQSLEESLVNLQSDREKIINELSEIESRQSETNQRINDLKDEKYQIEIKVAKGETQLETMKEKLWEEFEITYAQAADLRDDDFVYSRATREAREIRSRMRELGDVNVGAIAEYEQVSERYEFLTEQRDDINKAKMELESVIDELDKTIKIKFKENFDKVVDNFQNIFIELFGGGQAELRLENEDDPLNSGIDIIAQPPGKKLQNINLMSGGEKTMTAIALMFAVLKTKPTPFCILDEVEAALDDNNIDRFANYLKNFNEIQFTLVTHQKATMEHADVLYGVTMPEHGISKMLSLRLGDEIDLD